MNDAPTPKPDRRWPKQVYGVGTEPDPRFSMANERTFLAWIRTSLGFLAAGLAVITVARLAEELPLELRLAAVALIMCGLVCALGGFRRWMRLERAIRLGEPLPSTSAMPFVAVLLALVAVAGLILIGVV
jgi:putative membrane protein